LYRCWCTLFLMIKQPILQQNIRSLHSVCKDDTKNPTETVGRKSSTWHIDSLLNSETLSGYPPLLAYWGWTV
jgi:hypothetical protein